MFLLHILMYRPNCNTFKCCLHFKVNMGCMQMHVYFSTHSLGPASFIAPPITCWVCILSKPISINPSSTFSSHKVPANCFCQRLCFLASQDGHLAGRNPLFKKKKNLLSKFIDCVIFKLIVNCYLSFISQLWWQLLLAIYSDSLDLGEVPINGSQSTLGMNPVILLLPIDYTCLQSLKGLSLDPCCCAGTYYGV